MMFTTEIYVFIIITLITTIQGTHQSCANYCRHSTNQTKTVRRDCNCTALHQNSSKTRLVTTSNSDQNTNPDYETLKLNSAAASRLGHPSMRQLNASEYDKANYKQTIPLNEKEDEQNSTNILESNIDFPIYLDIDLHAPENANASKLKEEIIHIFEMVRASEKDLSKCINLHVYIFSKNNDNTNQTHTNWGQHVKNDSLSNSALLTEIQNKCDQPTTIIHESIYEIRQREQKEEDYSHETQDSIEYNNYTSGMKNIRNIQDHTHHRSLDVENNILLETTTTISNDKVSKGNIGRAGRNSPINYDSSSSQSDEEYFNYTRRQRPVVVSNIEFRDTLAYKGSNRKTYAEKEILIPKIITKELPNNTVITIIDGYETIPNLDFVSDNTYYEISKTGNNDIPGKETNAISNELELSYVSNTDKLNNSQSNIIQEDQKGDLFFMFGNNQIPARYIQNFEGEMQLAVDGYSLCDQTIQNQDAQYVFMNLLCDCIKLRNCSFS